MGEEQSFTISIPADNEGYVLLKCPKCSELFKLRPFEFKQDSVFDIYCPCCGLVSDSYITEDVLELAQTMIGNYFSDMFDREIKKIERQTRNSMLQVKVKNKTRKKKEMPIMLTVETLDEKLYLCCKKTAKIKPIIKMSGSYCPYCGVIDYGIE